MAATRQRPRAARRPSGRRSHPDAARPCGASTRKHRPALDTGAATAQLRNDAHRSTPATRSSRRARSARPREWPRSTSLRAQATALAAMDYDVPVRQGASATGDRIQRRASAAATTSYYDLLASEARLCNFVAIAQGKLPQESWFALGRLLTVRRRRAGPAGVERLDVRVPDAAAGDADLREYAARSDLSSPRSSARSSTEGNAACRGECRSPATTPSTSISTISIAPSAFPGLGLKRGLAEDLVVAPYASALALMVAPEAACLNLQRLAAERTGRKTGFVRGDRLHTVAAAPRRIERRGPVVHGASPGDEPAVAAPMCCWRGRCKSASSRTRCFRRRCFCCRSAFRGPTLFHSHAAELSDLRAAGAGAGVAGARPHQPGHDDSGSAAAVERPLPRDGHQCRRRQQPLEGPRRDPLARRRHLRQLGHLLLPPRRGQRRVLVDRAISRRCKHGEHYEAIFSEGRAEFRRRDFDFETHTEIVVSPEDDIEVRRVHITNRSRSRPRRSTSRATPKWFSRRRPRTRCIRRSATCSCKPRFFEHATRDSLHAPSALARRAGAVDVSSDDRAWRDARARSRSRRIACASSVAAVRSPHPRAMIEPGRAVEHRRLRAGSDRGDPPPNDHRRRRDGDDRHGLRRRRDARRRTAVWSTSIRIAVWPIACSS